MSYKIYKSKDVTSKHWSKQRREKCNANAQSY
jgi:hypothetical protein